jgi:hypothetical protein
MNSVIIKYNKISGTTEGGFNGAATTLQEQDIVAMMTAVKRKHVPTGGRPSNPKNDTDMPANPNKRKMLPFVKHFKSSTSSDAPNYKVGDSKNWDNTTTWYFCDCPNHRDKIKLPTHAADTCRTRLRWLEGKSPAVANQGEVQTDNDGDAASAMTDNNSTATDISGLLASAMSLAGDNPVAMELIADTLNATHNV